MQDLTDRVQQVIWDSGIQVGMVNVFQLISGFIPCVNLSEPLSLHSFLSIHTKITNSSLLVYRSLGVQMSQA